MRERIERIRTGIRTSSKLATLRLLPAAGRGRTLALAATTLLGGLLPNAFRVASGALVGSVPAAVRDGFRSPAGHHLIAALVVVAILFVAQQMTQPLGAAISGSLGRRLGTLIRERVLRATLGPATIAHLEDPALLDKIKLAQGVGSEDFTPAGAVTGFAIYARARVDAIGATILFATFNWWLAIVLALTHILTRRRLLREFHKIVRVMIGRTQELRRAHYFRDLAITPGAAKESRVFGLGSWIVERFHRNWLEAMSGVWEERKKGRGVVAAIMLTLIVVETSAFWALVHAAVLGHISVAKLAVCAGALFGMGQFGNISGSDLQIEHGSESVPAALELERATAGIDLPGAGDAAGLPRSAIRFENVSFTYSGGETPVFRDLNLDIQANRSLAIVGSNGAGKTTLVKLLARLYDPTSGRITADGIDLRDLDAAAWQRRVAAIFQDFVRYDLPARDNVGFGAIEHLRDDAALDEAVRRAGATSVIEALPNGWDTTLSRQYADGVDLSGGQWQRIALARALFAVDGGAGVLVLDEPTANLDVRAEADIIDRFLEVTQGSTAIVISHRFSTVRRADRIVVLEQGRVAEDGTHDELVAAGGRYAQMFALQASRFTDA